MNTYEEGYSDCVNESMKLNITKIKDGYCLEIIKTYSVLTIDTLWDICMENCIDIRSIETEIQKLYEKLR